jgi:tetratricopeptide (TPR) repeat protein
MKTKHLDNKELEQLLANSVEPEPPPWLQTRIMAEIAGRRPSLFERLRRWWQRPQSVSFSPAWLVSTVAVAVCAFWLGTLSEQHGRPDPAGQTDGTLPVLAANAEANYLLGRGLLAAGQKDQALTFLRQAVRQEPEVAEFAHWQGVAYWAVGESSEERQSYLRSMQKQPDFLPTLLNLGHNYLESGEYRQALSQYEKVLSVDPLEANALYNRALAYHMLKDSDRAQQAFIGYLEHHRTGKWAFRAISHLQQLGNFTFRSYRIGTGQVVLNMAALLAEDTPARGQELMHLAEALSRAAAGDELHLIVYNQGNRSAAKATATALMAQLTHYLGDEHGIPVRVSWFDAAETVTDVNGSDRQLPTSLFIFTRPKEQSNRRNSI